jgi:hypothetical protein
VIDVLPVDRDASPLSFRGETHAAAPGGGSAKRAHAESSGVERVAVDMHGGVDGHAG